MPMVYRLHPSVMRPNIYKQGFNLDNASCHFVVQKGKQTMFLQVIIFRREILNPEGDNFGSTNDLQVTSDPTPCPALFLLLNIPSVQ